MTVFEPPAFAVELSLEATEVLAAAWELSEELPPELPQPATAPMIIIAANMELRIFFIFIFINMQGYLNSIDIFYFILPGIK